MINELIAKLVRYSRVNGLTEKEDETVIVNALMDALGVTEFEYEHSS